MTYNQWPPRFHDLETVLGAGEHKLSLNDYLADPAPEPSLSPSIAHWLLSASPAHAWREHPRLNPDYRQEVSAKLDLGSAAHAILLENAGERIVIVHAKDYRTKEAQAARAEAHEQPRRRGDLERDRAAAARDLLRADGARVEALPAAADLLQRRAGRGGLDGRRPGERRCRRHDQSDSQPRDAAAHEY